ncbi:2-iminobutanoate/2-iminopropanoate deaminase-like [Ixodes scapularis]|uniref:2-iminobutanoate/2-iminopropanoate deaminase-like n=1 Tax=Ixodes scapularis TaxID=6945 RepID=UPI001A9F8511|nr:2-iminobutanoate/2-iminopropanoate deaminase-like [Ixodes scapularis]
MQRVVTKGNKSTRQLSVGVAKKMSKMTRQVIPYSFAKEMNLPSSAAFRVGNTMYISGVIGYRPRDSDSVVPGGIVPETRLALTNLGHLLEMGKMTHKNVVKCTVYLADLKEIGEMNKVYSEFFPEEPPARVAIQVASLSKDARVCIEAIAVDCSD